MPRWTWAQGLAIGLVLCGTSPGAGPDPAERAEAAANRAEAAATRSEDAARRVEAATERLERMVDKLAKQPASAGRHGDQTR